MKNQLHLVFILLLCASSAYAQPHITAFSPSSGAVGALVTITGTGFNSIPSNNIVHFGFSRATVLTATTTQLTVTVPSRASDTKITVTTAGRIGVSTLSFKTTFLAPLNITNQSVKSFSRAVHNSAFGLDSRIIKYAFGDFNSDGFIDLITYDGNSNYLIHSNSVGAPNSFASTIQIPADASARALGSADLDGDGLIDFVATNNAGRIFVRRNISTSTITFAPQFNFIALTNDQILNFEFADFNNDGLLDIIVSRGFNTTIIPNTSTIGNISFGTPFQLNTASTSVYTSDLNFDGKVDIICSESTSSSLGVIQNNHISGPLSAASFLTPVTLTIPEGVYSANVGDVDGDGKPDLVALLYTSIAIRVWQNNIASPGSTITTSSFSITANLPTPSNYGELAIANFDGDNKPDIVCNNYNSLVYYKNNTTSGSILQSSFPAGVSFTQGTVGDINLFSRNVYINDFNNDGKPDLFTGPTVSWGAFTFYNLAKIPQTISFPTIAPIPWNTAPFPLIATSSSGRPVTFTSSSSFVASISGNVLTPNAPGVTNLNAFDLGDDLYESASQNRFFEVQKANQIISFTLPIKTFGDIPFAIAGTTSSGLPLTYSWGNPSVVQMFGNTVTIVGAGTSTITASQNASGSTLYNPATLTQTITVNKANQIITFTVPTKTFGDGTFLLNATTNAGPLPFTFTSSNTAVATVSAGNVVDIWGAGTTTITASQAGTTNYNSATAVQILTVNKANQTVTFNAIPVKNFGDPSFGPGAISSSGLPITYSSSNPSVASVSGNLINVVGVGFTDITATQAGNANYNPASSARLLVVEKANQSIAFNALAPKSFGEAPFSLVASSTSSLPVSFTSNNPSVATVSGSTVTIVGVGSATITASQPGSTNYNAAANVQQTLTVNKATQTITFAALTPRTIGDAPFTLTGSVNSPLPISYSSADPAVATISGSTVTIVGTGTTTITAAQAGNTNYNAAVSVAQNLTVNKRTQTITFASLPARTFGDAPFSLNAIVNSPLTLNYSSSNTLVATITGTTVTIVGAGSTVITAAQAGDSNYNPASNVQQTLTVNKAAQTLTFNPLIARNFGDAPFLAIATVSSPLAVSFTSSNTSVATISGNTITIVGAGTTDITASQPGNGNFNAALPITRALTVNKTDQSITFNTLSNVTFGDVPFDLTGTSSSALPLTYTSSNTSVATISGNTVTILAAGTTTITASQPGNANINPASSVFRSLTVNKANQTISFSALSAKNITTGAFTLSAIASSGLPVSFLSSNNSVATISGNMVTLIAVGTTNITATQSGNTNWNAAPSVIQVQVVNAKVNQTITFNVADKNMGGPSFPLTGSASSGLPVSYSTSSPDKISISGNTATILKPGRATITASQNGDADTNDANSVSVSFCINPVKPIISVSNNNSETPLLTSSAAQNNQWYKNNALINGATSTTLAVDGVGLFKVATNQDDCTSSSDVFAIVVTGNEPADPAAATVSVSPNPSEDEITVHGIKGEYSYQLLSMIGTKVSFSLEKMEDTQKGYIGHLPQGAYILIIKQGKLSKAIKVLKK